MGAGGLGPCFRRSLVESVTLNGVGAELSDQEPGQDRAGGVERAGIGEGGLGERPSPALAVVLRLRKAFGSVIIDGRPIGVHGCAGLLAIPGAEVILGVFGQDVERRERLELPGIALGPVAHHDAGERQQVAAGGGAIRVHQGAIQPLGEELQRPGPVALVRGDDLSVVRATMEHPGHDDTVVLALQEALGRRLEQPSVVAMHGDDRIPEGVDFIHPPEPPEALDRPFQVAADAVGLGLRIAGEPPVALVRVLVVARGEELVASLAIALAGDIVAAGQREARG